MKKQLRFFSFLIAFFAVVSLNAASKVQVTNLMAGWDGNGITGAASKPNDVGWTNSVTASIPWTVANGSGGCRFRDSGVSGGYTAGSFTFEGGAAVTTRQLMLRYDNAAYSASYYAYPVTLEANSSYTFSFDYVCGGSATPPQTLTVGAGLSSNASDRVSSKVFTTSNSATVYVNGTYTFISGATAGTYYITFNGDYAWFGINNLSLTKNATVDKAGLLTLINSATTMYNNQQPVGTSTVYADLNTVLIAAQTVYNNVAATALEVSQQEAALTTAIANVNSAIALQARIAAWISYPYNATVAITNPSFEASSYMSGWDNPNGFAKATSAAIGSYKEGNVFVEKWVGSPGVQSNVKVSQLVKNLPNGIYKLTAGAQAIQQTATPSYPGKAYIFANADSVEVFIANNYSVRTVVTNNTINLGFAVKTTGNWIALDNFQLSYLGTTDKDVLNTLIDSASVLVANPVAVASTTVYPELSLAITNAQGVFDNSGATLSEIEAQEAALKVAIANVQNEILLKNRKDTWTELTDVTSVIVNPSFEISGTNGWVNVGAMALQNNTSFAPKQGTYYVERWQASGNWTGLKLSQLIQYIPNGDYTLTAGALNNPETTGGAFVYANTQKVEVFTTKDYSVDVTVTNNQLEIGFEVSNGGNYVAVDNFRLTFVAHPNGTGINQPNTNKSTFLYLNDGRVAINFNLEQSSNVELSLYNSQGALLKAQKANFTNGNNNVVIDAVVGSGVYFVKMNNEGHISTFKIVK